MKNILIILFVTFISINQCSLAAPKAKKKKVPARYWKLNKDPRPGNLTEKEYQFIRKHIPTGDPHRGLTWRELEALDPWYRPDVESINESIPNGSYTK